jgi:hypothetical protein
MFTLKNPDDGSPIRELIVLDGRLLSITEKCTYAIQMADQIDPGRTNPDLPHHFQQKLFDHGVNSELLCRSLLHAKVMFWKEFQQIEIERAMQLSFDVLSELVAMDEAAQAALRRFPVARAPHGQWRVRGGRSSPSRHLPEVCPPARAIMSLSKVMDFRSAGAMRPKIESLSSSSRCE